MAADGEHLFNGMEQHRVTVITGVPTVHMNLADYMSSNNKQLHHLKQMTAAGSACPAKLLAIMERYDLTHCCNTCFVFFIKEVNRNENKRESDEGSVTSKRR